MQPVSRDVQREYLTFVSNFWLRPIGRTSRAL